MAMSVVMLEGPQGVVRTTLAKTIKLPGTCSESMLRALGRPRSHHQNNDKQATPRETQHVRAEPR